MGLKFYTQDGFAGAGAGDARVSHGFFTRLGGVSDGVYGSLNVGFGSRDDVAAVEENRARIARAVGVEAAALLTVYQEHGAGCLTVTELHDVRDAPKADAMVTDVTGIALGVMTADCGPVLFYGEKDDGAPVIGAAHAGWQGALKGVLGATVDAMEALGAARDGVQAVVGPCIGKSSYEVSAAFVEPFMDEDEENERFFAAGAREGHPLFDLAGYCAFKLSKAGVKTVFLQDRDTYVLEDDFFSYRRATHRNEDDYGRQISVIALR